MTMNIFVLPVWLSWGLSSRSLLFDTLKGFWKDFEFFKKKFFLEHYQIVKRFESGVQTISIHLM